MTLSSERGKSRAWWIAAPPPSGPFDGIVDFSRELASRIDELEPARLVSSHAEITSAAETRGILLQYSPPAFVTRDLPRLLSAMTRLRGRGIPIVTTVHEYWPPVSASFKRDVWRWLCKRALHRVAARSSRVVATTPYARSHLLKAGIGGARGIDLIRVPSAVLPAAAPRRPGGPPVLAMFGQPFVLDRAVVLGLARWIEAQSPRPRWIWIARSLNEMRNYWREIGAPDVVEFHGELPSPAVSALIAEASIGLAVYDDGVSTRRSSLAALLAHGLPIVGLDGRFTDDLLRASGAFVLSPLGDAPALIANLRRVMDDEALRTGLAAAASRLHDAELAWPGIAGKYLALLRASP